MCHSRTKQDDISKSAILSMKQNTLAGQGDGVGVLGGWTSLLLLSFLYRYMNVPWCSERWNSHLVKMAGSASVSSVYISLEKNACDLVYYFWHHLKIKSFFLTPSSIRHWSISYITSAMQYCIFFKRLVKNYIIALNYLKLKHNFGRIAGI